jgi:hypothetical protein
MAAAGLPGNWRRISATARERLEVRSQLQRRPDLEKER